MTMEPYHPNHHTPNGLTSPFEYIPRIPGSFHQDRSQLDPTEPDDFYRPFAERISQPDIVLHEDDLMAAPSKRRQTNINSNGTAAKPNSLNSSPSTPPVTRHTNRSTSGPAGSQTAALNNARSAPVLATATRTRTSNGLIKERLKQFDATREGNAVDGASRYGRSRTPSGSNPSATTGQEVRHAKNSYAALPRGRAGSNTPGRLPLFGEVIDAKSAAEDPGYGISRIEAEDTLGHMHKPNAMFSRSRSHSDIGTPPETNDTEPREPLTWSLHQRAQSDGSAAPEIQSATVSPSSGRASPNGQTLSSQSKIPVRARRTLDIGVPKNSPARNRVHESSSSPPSMSQKPATTRINRPSSPAPLTLSARRYSPPKRLFEPGQRLSAVVTAPPPKTSPPLRSMKQRQPVTQATTNASRSKVSDRFKPPSSQVTTGQLRPKPNIPGQVDIAARRARLQKNLQGGSPDSRPVRHDLKALQAKKSGVQRFSTKREDSGVASTRSSGESQAESIPTLYVETTENESQAPDDVDTEFEESPILGNGIPETLNNVVYDPTLQVNTSTQAQSIPESRPGQSNSLLKHVMGIRQSDPSLVSGTARTQLPDDFLSQCDDGETIQILLGATPKMFQNDWQKDEQIGSSPEAFHTPREESEAYTPRQDEGSDIDVFDGRSSIYPDDSVSVVFQRKYEDYLASHPPPPLPANGAHLAAHQNFTLDSDARSQINHVLEQYQEGHVTPEMAQGFQLHVESLTPQLAQHNAWESPEATKNYLQTLLDPPTTASRTDSATPTPENFGQPTKNRYSDEDSEASGGIAIIYPPTGRSSSESFDRNSSQHSHTASNSTLRPTRQEDEKTYLDDLVFRPAPPPKDTVIEGGENGERRASSARARLPELTNIVDGLGLSLDNGVVEAPPKSPRPPIPTHQPPLSPPQASRGSSMAPPVSNEPPSPSIYAKKMSSELFVPGLPESPAPRSRLRGNEAVDSGYDKGAESNKPSLEITTNIHRSASYSGVITESPENLKDNLKRDKDKDLTERKNRIKELVDTEHSFHQDMTILMDIYMATSSSVLQDEDRRIVFGNVEQVRNFATEFLDDLKHAAASVYTIPKENRWNYKRGSFGTSHSANTDNSTSTVSSSTDDRLAGDRKTTIGQVFCEHLARIEKVYGDWLKGHTAANKRLIELQKVPAVKFWLDECHDSAKDITAAWSLDSLIIKPAQRLLKYPLLLTDLLKCTPADHPDYASMKLALEQIKAAASRINDLKRRAELVEEAMSKRRESDSKMKVGKLLNRRTEKLKQQVGLSNLADDQDYESVAQKFGGHFFQLQVVMRDVEKYLDDVQLYIDHFGIYMGAVIQNIQTDQERHPEKESNWLRFATTLQEIHDVALPDHIKNVRRSVIDPIQQLWRLHVGPQKMMAKRKKRLVEYVRHKTQVEKGEKPDKKLEQEAELYQAVNDTLKEELPKLYALTKKLVEACLLNFIQLQSTWQYTMQRKLEPFVEQKHLILEMELPEFFSWVQLEYTADLMDTEESISGFRICNGATLAEAQNFLSPATTFSKDDDSSHKRPSTYGSSKRAQSLTSELASLSTPNFGGNRLSDHNMGLSPLVGSFPMPDGLYQPTNSRGRAGSAMSSRGPSTPQSFSQYPGPSTYVPPRPMTSAAPSERSTEPSPAVPRLSLDAQSPPNESDHQFSYHEPMMPGAYTPDERYSGVFHSALPMSDSPRASSPEPGDGEAKVLFLAASLFEFHIDSTRKEAGYPYLTYQPGEIFDVIGQKGELWLAKNQDDSSRTIGWIWEKHFARILPEN